MTKGIITKGIGGFYYIKTSEGVIECKARGIFRKNKIIPMVGDKVVINKEAGVIEKIEERQNSLIRPAVSNIDMAMIVFALRKPNPNLNLLDKFLVMIEKEEIHASICFNKIDISEEEDIEVIKNIYRNTGYEIVYTSAKTNKGVDELKDLLKDKISVFAGPSGVGKSTLLNEIQPGLSLQTGDISEKTKRGKHTTRHVELIDLASGGMVLDTPGFTSLDIQAIEKEELQYYFPEIETFIGQCKFNGCCHINEPECMVKEKVKEGYISEKRYASYKSIYEEIESQRRY